MDKMDREDSCEGMQLFAPKTQQFNLILSGSPALYRHAVEQVCDLRRNKWHRTGWLLARAGYVSPCCKVMCYGICAFVLRCFFSVLTLYSQMEHGLGVNFFSSPPSPHVMLYFSSIPCLPVLSTALSYVCCVCMDRLMANFAGTCD